MKGSQPSFTDAEYSRRGRVTRREEFLTMMDQVIPGDEWTGLVEPAYYKQGAWPSADADRDDAVDVSISGVVPPVR